MTTQQKTNPNFGCIVSRACMLLITCVCLLAAIRPSVAQSEIPGLDEDAKRYANVYLSTERLKAKLALNIQLETGVATLQDIPDFSDLDNASQRAFRAVLGTNLDQLEQALTKYQQDQQSGLDTLKNELETQTQEHFKWKQELFNTKKSRHVDTRLAALLSYQNRWLWLAAFAAFFGILLVALHWNRHLIRRRLHGYKTVGLSRKSIYSILLFLLLFAFIFCFGPWFASELGKLTAEGTTPNAILKNQIDKLTQEEDGAEEMADRKQKNFTRMLDEWAGNQPPTASWKNILLLAANIAVDLEVQNKMSQEIIKQENDKIDDQGELKALNRRIQVNRSFEQTVYAITGLILLCLTAVGGFLLLRNVGRKQTEIRGTCPVCLTVGTLEDAEKTDEASYGMLRCNKVLTDEPFEECNFTFPGIYRDMQKLCFPTIGHPRAGKTHWLTMTYRQLIRGE